MKKLAYILLGIAILSACTTSSHRDSNNVLESKVDSVLAKLTLNEKIGQMMQISSYYSSDAEKLKELVRKGAIGSLLNEVDPKAVNDLQRAAVEESTHGIPLIIGRDVIHGFRTIFPIPLGQAAAWNPEIVEKSSHVAATEARSVGVTWTFSPMIDVARDPRWGRVAEGYGEDPLLTSTLGAAAIKGYQGNNLTNSNTMAACAKHFAAYGAVEAGRDYNTVILSDQELRNVYLPPFKAAVDAGAVTFMSAFNEINGVPATGNKLLLTNVLRNQWGFNGFVVSDWSSIPEMVRHGFATDEAHSAIIAAEAGIDMEMSSDAYALNLAQLVKEKKISEEVINNAVRNILRVKFQLGLFDNPYVDETLSQSVMATDSAMALAQKAAEESIVLLKNENNTLPLSTNIKRVAVIGPMANDRYEQLGTWIFDGDTNLTITPLHSIKKLLGNNKVLFSKALTHSRDNSTSSFAQAKSMAKSADAVVVFIGEESILSGEAHGRANIDLPGSQAQLVKELASTGKPVIAVIMAGRPLSIGNIMPYTSAILYAWHPGTMGGPAIANVLFGVTNPSGKLPISFPRSGGQCPIYYAKKNSGRPADYTNWVPIDKIPVRAPQTSLGNTNHHLDDGFEPLFSFGFGLSYTTFEYSDLSLSSEKMGTNGAITISVTITNTGKTGGYEIAQLYTHDVVGSITRPVKELKGFAKIWLDAGESKSIEFTLSASDLAFYKSWSEQVVEPGQFRLWVGGSSTTGLTQQFSIE